VPKPTPLLSLLVLGLVACAKAPTPAEQNAPMHCLSSGDARSQCMQYVEPLSDLRRESIFAQCREAGGMLVDACPEENLVGICEQPQNLDQAWTLARAVRTHFYLHPDVADDAAIETLAERCGEDNDWTYANESAAQP
jgi:hypothetical protein